MDHESTRRLRLDRRLASRRGWIAPEELTAELEALPDVSDKIEPPEEAGDAAEPASEEPGPEASEA